MTSQDPKTPEELKAALDAAKKEDAPSKRQQKFQDITANPHSGLRIIIELVAGIAVGGAIGYGLDYWLGSRPWGVIIMIILGALAGIYGVVKEALRKQK